MEARREAARRGRSETARRGRSRRGTELFDNHHRRDARSRDLAFGPAARRGSREASIRPPTPPTGLGGQRRVTPRQTCPRPDGFGRNLRSKTRWFTGFCNSHQVSHFATFFIDARAEISVAESRFDISKTTRLGRHRFRADRRALVRLVSLAQIAPGFV